MRVTSLFAASLLCAAAAAQKVGSEAPDITWTRTFVFGDLPAQKLSDLRGTAVLLEFWGTY